jgi:TNF receptor-associated protein 1
VPYKFKLHYSTDVPLGIKALLYIPSTHSEKFGMQSESVDVNLYSRKILIKAKAGELFPHYLRFVKGVVDCEDLPLNISRENYQDSSLMSKLRNVLTRRTLKLLEDESKKDPEKYNKWFNDFSNFLKEGISVDHENSETIFKLMRFNTNYSTESLVSIEDYLSKCKES